MSEIVSIILDAPVVTFFLPPPLRGRGGEGGSPKLRARDTPLPNPPPQGWRERTDRVAIS